MSLNDWIKEQEQRGITTFSFQQIRCVFDERSEKTLKTDINRLSTLRFLPEAFPAPLAVPFGYCPRPGAWYL